MPRPQLVRFPAPVSADSVDPPIDWSRELICYDNSLTPRPNTANAFTAFVKCPDWAGVLSFDEFRQQLRCGEPPPWGGPGNRQWTDDDDTQAAMWLQRYGMDVRTSTAREAAVSAALRNRTNSLRTHLDTLVWDEAPRVCDWLTVYFGVDDTPYTRAIGQCWLVSAVARAYQSGCQADHCLVLEGRQGIGKSTALRALAGAEYFAGHVAASLSDKEAAILCQGKWIVEFSELESLHGNRQETIKAFMTRSVDHYVPKYSNRAIDVPRSCVFAGTTNKQAYIADETGARRYWPVWCVFAHADELADMRDLLLAEAVSLYKAGAKWYLDRMMEHAASEEQASRQEHDAWLDPILNFILDGPNGQQRERVTVYDVLTRKLSFSDRDITRREQMRVSACLVSLGWRSVTSDGKRYYLPPRKVSHKPRFSS